MAQRILVILGHPAGDSFCAALAKQYMEAGQKAGKDMRILQLAELDFDPVLRAGYKSGQPLEPCLQAAQEAISWAEHLVFVYPIWWGAMPSLLKGFIDRLFLPGFAFKYRPDSILWDKLLAGRSADLLVTMDTPPWYYRWVQRMPGHHQMKKTILEFSGIQPVRIRDFGPIRGSSEAQRSKWLSQVQRLAMA